jgi:hypothetical protein
MKKALITLLLTCLTIAVTAILASAQSYPPGIISHWKFEEGIGSIVSDSVGNNDGTLTGLVGWTGGIVGSAIDVDEQGGGVRVPHSDSLSPTHAFTIEGWVYPRTLYEDPPGISIFVSKVQYFSTAHTNYLLGISPINEPACQGGGRCLQMRFGNISWYNYWYGSTQIEEQMWTHTAATYDGETTTLTLYVNGALDAVFTDIPSDPIANTAPFVIGWDPSTLRPWDHFDGVIDEVAIYDRALSAEEIQARYEAVVDADGDGVLDDVDRCLGSVADNIVLNPNKYAQNVDFGAFEVGPANDQSIVYDMSTTYGCTCIQIVEEVGAGKGHLKKGCSPGLIEEWTGVSANPDRKAGIGKK